MAPSGLSGRDSARVPISQETDDSGEESTGSRGASTAANQVPVLDPAKVRRLNEADASGGDNPTGVLGRTIGSCQTYGLKGVNRSKSENTAGPYRTGSGDAAAVEADGHVDIEDVRVSAYLTFNQTISSATDTAVELDDLVDNTDDFSGFNTSTGEYTVKQPGDYHLTTATEWFSSLAGGTDVTISMTVDGTTVAHRYKIGGVSNTASVADNHISETPFRLAKNQVIPIQVYQESGSDQTRSTGSAKSYLTIQKVG